MFDLRKEIRQSAQDLGFTVNDIQFNQIFLNFNANAASFDIIPAVANHIFFIAESFVNEASAITGNSNIDFYDLAAAAQNLTVNITSFNNPAIQVGRGIFVTRLRYTNNTASAGQVGVSFSYYDLTHA